MHRNHSKYLAAPLAALALAACSSDGDGGSTESAVLGLSLPGQITVVTVNEGATPGAHTGALTPAATADTSGFPATAAYNTDASRAHVYDPSMEALGTVNMILCVLKQTAYSGLVNEGLYKAQVDMESCEEGGDTSGGETGQSSGAQKQFTMWVVESSRETNSSDQVITFWIPQNHGGSEGPTEIRARMTIAEGVSDENPFGVFDLNWIDYFADSGLVRGFGNLHTLDVADGFIGFSFFEESGDVDSVPDPNTSASRVQANVTMTADQTDGVAHIVRQERFDFGGGDSGLLSSEFRVAFNPDNVLRAEDSDPEVCLARDEFLQRTWRYNLYDATTGARVVRNSGFGFRTQDGEYGWVGYHGLWVPNGVTLESGDTVTRDTYGSTAPVDYTLFVAPGKLVKNSRNTLALTALAGEVFEWWVSPGMGQPPARVRVAYQAPSWVITGEWNDGSHSYDPVEPPEVIDTSLHGFLGMWSQSLGGPVNFVHGATSITYFAQEYVTQASDLFTGGSTVDLYAYFRALDTGITGVEAASGDIYLSDSTDVNTPHHYVFDRATMTLSLDTGGGFSPAGLAEGETIASGPYTWGMQSGALVTSTAGFTTAYDIWNADVFYTYETGPNAWNKLTTVLDGLGDPVVFDAPLQFSYTHTTGDDANGDSANDGRTFLLQYAGAGQLHGIPHEGVDLNGDSQPDRWYPQFSIADGTLMGPTGTEYVVRAIESEYTLLPDVGGCVGMDLSGASSLTLPTSADWTDPALGALPAVSGPPRVIEGEVAGS